MEKMRPLTDRQRDVLYFIKSEIQQKGYPPSVREIGDAVGLCSSSTVHGHMVRLEEKGFIRRDPSKPRAIEILDEVGPGAKVHTINVPILGRVAAGPPLLASDTVEGQFPIPVDFVKNTDATSLFMLTVQGDSMIEAGIHDGDYLLVRRQPVANNGEIVVALIDDEATVKRFFKEQRHVRLQPENRYMDPILVTEVQIVGKVVGVIRNMEL